MILFILFKVLCLSLIFTVFVVAEKSSNGCDEVQTYFEGKENNIITISYCEENDNGYVEKLSVIQNWDYELSEEDLTKLLSYEHVRSLEFKGFIMTQSFINGLAELSDLEELIVIHTSFENGELDYTPLKRLSSKLKTLELDYNWYEGNIFKKLKMLTNLKKLTFFDENISKDHIKAISKFTNVNELLLVSWNGLKKDVSFSPLKNLKKLSSVGVVVYGGKIKKDMLNVFKSVKKLYLEEIDFSQTNIDELATLTNLEELKISYNSFPENLNYDSLKNLKKLTSFEVDSRDDQEKFEEIPEFIYSLTNLKRLVFKNQNIEIIPKKLSNLTNLEYIDLSDNKIDAELPESLSSLSNLKSIDLRGNRNLKGKTLTNESLESCYYEGNYSLCKAKDIACLEDIGINFSECLADDQVSINGKCGKGNGKCPAGKCCSKYGWCGTGENYCSVSYGCQSEFGDCTDKVPTSTSNRCGSEDGQCPSGQCCNRDGYCGTGDDFCSADKGCQSEYGTCDTEVPLSTNGRCGKGKGKCTSGQCCSKYGWCGSTDAHCSVSAGCQSEFGKCH